MLHLKFTMKEPSKIGQEMLDTFIYSKDGKIHTKPYSKPCDDHSFLAPNSCHPTHNLKNIPYSTAHRIFRICSEPEEYSKSKAEYTTYLLERGYSSKLIEDSFTKVESLNRLDLIGYNKKKPENLELDTDSRVFPLVTEFNPGFPNISHILNIHKHLFDLDPVLKNIIKPEKIFVSFKGNPTLLDTLVHSKLPPLRDHALIPSLPQTPSQASCKPCQNGCYLCKNYLVHTKTFSSYHTSQQFSVNLDVDCNSKDVIYLINDKICRLSNVGCTTDITKIRFSNHKSHIKLNKRTCEISKHFSDCEVLHNLDKSSNNAYDISLRDHIELHIIEQVIIPQNMDVYERLKKLEVRENYWKDKLRTWSCFGGLNTRI